MSSTKKLPYAELALLFVLALAIPATRLDAQKSSGSLEREGMIQAQELIKKIVQSDCGDDSFSKKYFSGSIVDRSSTSYWQYKGLTWSVVPTRLSEAEELNGIEFRGDIVIKARVFRWYYGNPSDGRSQWHDWQDFGKGDIRFRLEKKKGQWAVPTEISARDIGNEAPSCDEIKQIVPEIDQQKQKGPKGRN